MDPGTDGVNHWGPYAPAIARWEQVTRPAPAPTDGRGRLSPAFVEWVMGLDAGHVTGVPGLSRAAQLTALGNGVVPQQACRAMELLDAATILAGIPAHTHWRSAGLIPRNPARRVAPGAP